MAHGRTGSVDKEGRPGLEAIKWEMVSEVGCVLTREMNGVSPRAMEQSSWSIDAVETERE